jgi:hypothetical protein
MKVQEIAFKCFNIYREVRVTEMHEKAPPLPPPHTHTRILSTKSFESAPLIQAPGVQPQKIIEAPKRHVQKYFGAPHVC